MERKYIWNIERKPKKYWLSFILLLIPCLFIVSVHNGPILCIYEYTGIETEIFGRHNVILIMFDFILIITFSILIIIIIEVCLSIEIRKQNKNTMSESSLYSFICYPQFKADILILIVIVIAGVFEIDLNTDLISRDSSIFIFFLVCLLAGIYINLSCVFPWKSYSKIQNTIKEKKDIFQEAWICISTYTEVSTFSVLPGACKEVPVVVTPRELSIINRRKDCHTKIRDFNKLLIIIGEGSDKKELRNMIEKYSSYLHMKCLVILENKSQNNQYEEEINILKERMDAQIIFKFQNIYSLNMLEEYLGIKYAYNVVKCLNEGNSLKNMGRVLDDVYLNIIHGPAIAVKFFRLCLLEPNLSKAIYRFFDYIDLQYRLVCAFFVPANLNWYVKKSEHIGNYRKMFKFLAGNLKDLTTLDGIETQYILSDDMRNTLEKYLPNCSKNFGAGQKMESEEIKNFSAELRNKLRAHQDMELVDVPILLNLVFRLAIATNYLLGINEMVIAYGHNGKAIGSYRGIEEKTLSPFIEPEQGYDWIFNNAKKVDDKLQMEYVNFLTGKVKKGEEMEKEKV